MGAAREVWDMMRQKGAMIFCEQTAGGPESFKYSRSWMPLEVPLGYFADESDEQRQAIWAPGKEKNGFLLVLGGSGSGKTEALKKIIHELVRCNAPVLVIDFHGDLKVPDLQNILMSAGRASFIGINPLAINFDITGQVGPKDQRSALISMFTRALPALGHIQRRLLHEAVDEAFASAGISDDVARSWRRKAPKMGHVLDILESWSEDKYFKSERNSIRGCISAIHTLFDHPIFDREEMISIDEMLSSSTRIDLSKVMDDGVQYVVADTLLRMIFNELRQRGPIPVRPECDVDRFRLFVVIDEAKILSMGGGDPNCSKKILNILATEGRKYGIGLILASQVSDHFGAETKANMGSQLILQQTSFDEAKKCAKGLRLIPDEVMDLSGRGEGLFRSGVSGRVEKIQVQPIWFDDGFI